MNTVTFQTPAGPISLSQTGPTTATMVEPGGTYDVGNVESDAASLSFDVLDQPLWITPHVIVTWSEGSTEDDVTITISKSWSDDGAIDYPVSPTDLAAFLAFKQAAFPTVAA